MHNVPVTRKAKVAAQANQWTARTPTVSGVYWWRQQDSKQAMIVIVTRGSDGRLLAWDQDGTDLPLPRWPSGLWAGPLQPPPIEE